MPFSCCSRPTLPAAPAATFAPAPTEIDENDVQSESENENENGEEEEQEEDAVVESNDEGLKDGEAYQNEFDGKSTDEDETKLERIRKSARQRLERKVLSQEVGEGLKKLWFGGKQDFCAFLIFCFLVFTNVMYIDVFVFCLQDRKHAIQLFIDHKDNIKEIEGTLVIQQQQSWKEKTNQQCLTPRQMRQSPYFFSESLHLVFFRCCCMQAKLILVDLNQ